MMVATKHSQIKKIIQSAKKDPKDRVYYRPFGFTGFKEAILQPHEKSQYDCVALDKSKNESVHYYGFAQDGSYLSLHISILSFFPDVQRPNEESRWRLAIASLVYVSEKDACRYWYLKKELIDYEDKRQNIGRHDVKSTYKIGSVSVETVVPFALTRILFNGVMNKTSNLTGLVELVQARLSISTHPTGDKFDYKYKFNKGYFTRIIENSAQDIEEGKKLLGLCLEDRIDQPLMFQGQLEVMVDNVAATAAAAAPETVIAGGKFIMWGGRLRKYIDPHKELSDYDESCERESLLIFAECGHTIHLTRLVKYPNVIYGMLSSGFDYASYLYSSAIFQHEHGNKSKEVKFDEINSFSDLLLAYKVNLTGYKGLKTYSIEVASSRGILWPEKNENGPTNYLKVKVNGYDGWAVIYKDNLEAKLRQAQRSLFILDIHDRELANHLASVQLLGGKGNSLVDLVSFMSTTSSLTPILNPHYAEQVQISVPRALVFTCVAYQMWLNSDLAIGNSVRVLDDMRKCSAAGSICVNPMSDKYLSPVQRQQTLKELCKSNQEHLKTIPLSDELKKLFYAEFVRVFGKESLGIKTKRNELDECTYETDEECPMFAVRSSAVGEDSLETSAAGQMKTLLCVRGFDQICKAVVECWASQFDIEAVTYKSQNGLPLHMPMAVVVQEQIHCEVAGVASTCDSLTGNKSHVEILANPGLGEGVVSGKETDTIRVSMLGLPWDMTCESPRGYLTLEEHCKNISIVSSDSRLQAAATKEAQQQQQQQADGSNEGDNKKEGEIINCCLTNERIISLANLLIQIRRFSQIRDREMEWGITSGSLDSASLRGSNKSETSSLRSASSESSSSSSSSSAPSASPSASSQDGGFHIHLLQSRPLTHLARLSARETDHELDFGFVSPLDVVSRANIGEVMPGALCPINLSYFATITSIANPRRPREDNHTQQVFVADSFGFFRSLGCMVLTHTDLINQFDETPADKIEAQMAAMHILIGTSLLPEERIRAERSNPIVTKRPDKLMNLILMDRILVDRNHQRGEKLMRKTKLDDDLTSLDVLGGRLRLETTKMCDEGQHAGSNLAFSSVLEDSQVRQTIRSEAKVLFERLCTSTEPITVSWVNHVKATITSITLNFICMVMLSKQPGYPDEPCSAEILNDFSILIRGEQKTEGGDVSQLLEKLVDSIVEEGKLEEAKKMDNTKLYNYLSFSQSQTRRLYDEIMEKNGHRAYKEFDFASHTWADDPSTLIKSLAIRLKQAKPAAREAATATAAATTTTTTTAAEGATLNGASANGNGSNGNGTNGGNSAPLKGDDENEIKTREILEKIEKHKLFITGYLLPRARNAVVRREKSKSLVIRAVDKYRKAFRHLGGLLCLEGRLPSADLVFQLTFQELDRVVHLAECERADLARLIYKARRRQQRARLMSTVNFPQPTMKFNEMYQAIESMSSAADQIGTSSSQAATVVAAPAGNNNDNNDQQQQQLMVRGITSCAGCVTGRACVVQSLDDMDQVEPNDILITYSIDISWSVYFFCLAGIVTEVGGIVSHGAVIAREYGIPTLCTAVGACAKFKTGQMITLNANEGVCYPATNQQQDQPVPS